MMPPFQLARLLNGSDPVCQSESIAIIINTASIGVDDLKMEAIQTLSHCNYKCEGGDDETPL